MGWFKKDERMERMLDVLEKMSEMQAQQVELQAEVSRQQAAVMEKFLDLFRASGDPSYRMNGDEYREAEENAKLLRQMGYPSDGSPHEQSRWLAEFQLGDL